MQDVVTAFREAELPQGCIPLSLLLHEILLRQGVPSEMKCGYFVTDKGGRDVLAVSHVWVQLTGADDAVLDIGSQMYPWPPSIKTYVSQTVPAGAERPRPEDPFVGEYDSMVESTGKAAVAGLQGKDKQQVVLDMERYWSKAPPQVTVLRSALLLKFAPPG